MDFNVAYEKGFESGTAFAYDVGIGGVMKYTQRHECPSDDLLNALGGYDRTMSYLENCPNALENYDRGFFDAIANYLESIGQE